MPGTHVTVGKAEELLAVDKVITANLAWRPWGPRGFRLEATVLTVESKEILKLFGWVGAKGLKKRSLSLLYNSISIKRLCLSPHSKHTNSDGVPIDGMHKHQFDEFYETRNAYIPNDITTAGDINQELLDFLKECRITLKGNYEQWLPI
ncbi:MAG: hypothetical protein Q8P59_04765 [Dehalococcoidia bacterium]|nr:hypothetical protein [Dehalococcoidia bacterium]